MEKKKKARNKSIVTQLTFIVAILIALSTVAVGTMGYLFYRRDCIKLNGEKAMAVAQGVAAAVEADDVATAIATGEKTEFWHEAKEMADATALDTGTVYLYVLGADIGSKATYYLEGYNPATGDDEFDLGDTEATDVFAAELPDALASGNDQFTGLYEAGGFGAMVTGFATVVDSSGKVVAIVGADLSVDSVLDEANTFGATTILIVLVAIGVAIAATVVMLKRSVGKPIVALEEASEKIAVGDLDIDLTAIHSDNEVGMLAKSFQRMVKSTSRQVEILEDIAEGDLSNGIKKRSDADKMSAAMINLSDTLNGVFAIIRSSSANLSNASGQIAQSSQHLADGATEQSSTMDTLSGAMDDVADKAQHNVETAGRATTVVEDVRDKAQQGSVLMENMLQAVQDIDTSTTAIAKVVKAIDEIASQTNILALNAAVEAARAGEHGKGFAVVAEEVRNLAAKSAESAKESERLINDSLEKTRQGVDIAQETAASFEQIVTGVAESNELIGTIQQASGEQSEAVTTTHHSLSQITQVVQENSAASEQSAAAAVELNQQADQLAQMVKGFKLRHTADAADAAHVFRRALGSGSAEAEG